jgi:hypothetical protein
MGDLIPEQVVRVTEQMRRGETREMRDLRGVLASRGIDVNRTVCASAYDDLLDSFICVLVLPDGEAIEYSASYDDLDDPESGPARSTEWHEADGCYRVWIEAGRTLLGR